MVTRAALKRRTGHIFYTGASLAIVIVVFVGFAPTYYLKGYFQTAPLPLVNHLHGVVFTGWIVLFAAQVRLVAVHRVDLHRRLGVAGAWLAGAVVTLGVTAALLSGRHNFAAGNDGALAFLVIPFGDMLTFCVLTTAGLYYRRRPDVHRRLMLLATVTLLGAAIARWPLPMVASGPTAFFATTDLFIAAALVHDFASERRLHPANLWGGALVVLSQPLRLALAGTGAWLAIARAMLG